ncbi:MAG: hypothetical protein D6732_23245 [Methanobacteriota archaeon]|nr:MAG: hypothetical protein D6732_23245 [Euryarchaeota archaeon]
MNYYYVYSESFDPCELVEKWYAPVSRTWLCKRCKRPKPGTGPLIVQVKKKTVRRIPLNRIFDGLLVASADFVELLSPELLAQIDLGNLLDERGKQIPGYYTVRAQKEIIIRGRVNIFWKKCPCCGRFLYYSDGKHFLCPEPPSEYFVLGSKLRGLVFPESVFNTMKMKLMQMDWVVVEKLRVEFPPKDGLPIDLSTM